MRVMVTGATGFIGSRLVQLLLAEGIDVLACARNAALARQRFPAARVIRMDFTDHIHPTGWLEHLDDVAVVVNTVGIFFEAGRQTFQQLHVEFPHSLFKACELAGVTRVIHISALGAEESAISRYHQTKYAADNFLRSLSIEKHIIKPSFVYGANGKSTAFFRAMAALPLQIVVAKGEQPVQPVHIDDLCAAIVELVKEPDQSVQELEAVGPAPLPFRDMIGSYRQWLGYDRVGHESPGKSLRLLSVPLPLAMTFAGIAERMRNPWLSRDNLRMLEQGSTGSPDGMTSLLGRPPIAFSEALRQTPATDADRWYARLYFLLPLLRYAIGFVWIFSGLTSAFVYPVSDSYAMLQQVGLSGIFATLALYGAAALDVLLGLAVLARYQIILTGLLQLGVIVVYTLLISLYLPEFWFHPFGPIIKNIPFVLAILILMATEKK